MLFFYVIKKYWNIKTQGIEPYVAGEQPKEGQKVIKLNTNEFPYPPSPMVRKALDDLNIIHLPTGEVVHRNPNCVVVVTANVGQGYEGINNFSNDFIARFHQADVNLRL